MGILDFLRVPNMDQGVVEYKNTEGAVLLDVRTPQEYKEGYVPSSKNVPLQSLGQLESCLLYTSFLYRRKRNVRAHDPEYGWRDLSGI